ncbi:hypothetical protein OsJ_27845 [Oryza sativa Japonica Group]|uniref:DDE Tnp4 domain-containing protein n=1 Tax=Oryza sativa subsp. japonica TaxID=39947 RepID=B9G1N7_ORYSJ|nr:hypothetical protein OsJ_27845 [Oryza sativa Japonica Group]
MALPATMKVLSLVPGLILVMLAAVLTDASIELLVWFSRAVGATSYGEAMGDAFDPLKYTPAVSVALAVVFVVITVGIATIKLMKGQIPMPKLFPDVHDWSSTWRLPTAAPVLGERYHLLEWHRGMEPNTPMEKFNRVHSSIRNVIERSFGLLKMKWQILYKMPCYPMYKHKMIVEAAMVLHNYIREHGGQDPDFARFDRDPNFIPTIPERYNKYAVPRTASDESTPERSTGTMDLFRDELATALSISWR